MTSSPSPMSGRPVALIGFGEAGQVFARGWRSKTAGLDIRAFDIRTGDSDTGRAKWDDYASAKITGCETLGEALGQLDTHQEKDD